MAQTQTPPRSPEALTIGRIEVRDPGQGIEVLSEGIDADGAIAERHTQFGENLSLPLRWSRVEGAGAYAIVIEDPDAPRETPFVHWMIWNLSGETARLDEGLPAEARLMSPQNAVQGRNDGGTVGYTGPKPPPGTGAHRYHIQVFALDGPLTLQPDADLRALTDAMKGRVIADGELVATCAAPSGT